jgi:YVTN family beta-propeller protein
LQFDPAKVESVTVATGFEPKYWTVQETYDPVTGEYKAVLTPTQAGQLRAALGLDTTDTMGLQVTTTETQTVQTFALRSASFAALAEEPDYTVNLPDVPAGHFVTGAPIVTSPTAEDPTQSHPAGTVVTDRYAYVLNSNLTTNSSSPSTVSVIGADPDKADYLQVVDEIEVDGTALLLTQAGDRLYIASNSSLQVIDTDGTDPISEADDNAVLAPIDLGAPGGIIPVASPDGTKLYVINQGSRKIYVVDTDPANTATYHTVLDEIVVADPPTVVDNGDGTRSISGQFPLSAAFNADGTRMYVVRDGQAYTQSTTTGAISDFTFSGEIVTIDTTTNEIVGTPLPLEGDYGYFASSDGKYLYVPALTMNGFDPTVDTDISQITGSVNVIDVQDPDNPVIVANLPTGTMPVNVAFSPDKSLAYVVDAGQGTVWVIDTVNQQVLDMDPATPGVVDGLVFDAEPSAALGQVFNVIASSPDGTRLFVTNYGKGTVIPLEFVQDVV